tara:strand:- start:247 stop:432 length:186 start_codon:yes stop_codon:yes gene_type:complete
MKTLLTLKQNFRYQLLINPTISQASVNEDDECAKSNAVAAFLELAFLSRVKSSSNVWDIRT